MERFARHDVGGLNVNKGIIYIISGQKYARWALRSIISLRQNGGEAGKLPVHVHFLGEYIYEDQLNSLGCTCHYHDLNKDLSMTQNHRKCKGSVMNGISFDKYIMIDADTFVQNDFIDMFNRIPNDGVTGIEDGNFDSHLQMGKFLFIKGKVDDAREFIKNCLRVDYGITDDSFPPYYNVGVIGWSSGASHIVGEELFKLLSTLQKNPNYNSHDEQLPMNSILYHHKIPANTIDPTYNYTKSRLKKNKMKGIHDEIKESIKIIHNKSCIESDWINPKPVEEELERLLHANPK